MNTNAKKTVNEIACRIIDLVNLYFFRSFCAATRHTTIKIGTAQNTYVAIVINAKIVSFGFEALIIAVATPAIKKIGIAGGTAKLSMQLKAILMIFNFLLWSGIGCFSLLFIIFLKTDMLINHSYNSNYF